MSISEEISTLPYFLAYLSACKVFGDQNNKHKQSTTHVQL